MTQKQVRKGPVPPGNQPKGGPGISDQKPGLGPADGAPLDDQDPKHRLGQFQTAGEHSFKQPGGKNDANRG